MFSRTLVAGLLLFTDASDAQAPAATNPQVNQLMSPAALNISPDGRHLAFARETAMSTQPHGELLVYDFETKEALQVTSGTLMTLSFVAPVWSPDGTLLAYQSVSDGEPRLTIWSLRERKNILHSAARICSAPMCYSPAAWMPDGKSIVFIADVALEELSSKNAASVPQPTDTQDERLGVKPTATGVTVMISNAASEVPPTPRSKQGRSNPLKGTAQTRILSMEIATGAERQLAGGATFIDLNLARDGKSALAVELDTSGDFLGHGYRFSVHQFPLNGGLAGKLRLVAKQITVTGPWLGRGGIRLSPSGKWAVYVTGGRDFPSDVNVIDVASGRIRNVTAGLSEALSSQTALRLNEYFRGKFISMEPIWSPTEDSVFVLRPYERTLEGAAVPPGVELWRVPLGGAAPSRVPLQKDVSIEAIPFCVNHLDPCLLGPERELIAKVNVIEENAAAVAAIHLDSGRVRILHRLQASPARITPLLAPSGMQPIAVSARAGIAVGLDESDETPAEIWAVFLRGAEFKAAALDILNPGPVPAHDKVVRIHWRSPDGEHLSGRLQIPAGKDQPPMVMPVYGGGFYGGERMTDDGKFAGGSWWYDFIRNHGRYAILVPDLPAPRKANSRLTCDYIGRNVEAALDAAARTGLVDTEKAGIIGHSWGGYTVNCLVTRTQRFRAAIAIAGVSDLMDHGVWGGGANRIQSYTNASVWPWDDPLFYISETPLYRLDDVETPLLSIYGKRDLHLYCDSSTQMYEGLEALGKPAALVGYDHGDHHRMLEFPDLQQRVLRWLDYYILGEGRSPVLPAEATRPEEARLQ